MGSLLQAMTSYPTAIFTVLLSVVMIYWLLAMLGLVDFESSGIDLDLDAHADADAADLGTIASYVVALGLNGVPFSVAVSLVVLIAWTVSALLGMWVQPLVPTWVLGVVVGTGVLALSLAVAVVLTARIVRPMRGLFVTHSAIANAALVGQACRVLTGRVDEQVGRAEVARRGAGINIRVWAHTPNTLTKGSAAIILEYDATRARYLIQAAPDS